MWICTAESLPKILPHSWHLCLKEAEVTGPALAAAKAVSEWPCEGAGAPWAAAALSRKLREVVDEELEPQLEDLARWLVGKRSIGDG